MKTLMLLVLTVLIAFGSYAQSTSVKIESSECLAIQSKIAQIDVAIKKTQEDLKTASSAQKAALIQLINKLQTEAAALRANLSSCLAKLPDLRIESISQGTSQNGQRVFSVVVKNIGGATAGSCTLLFDTKGQKKKISFASLPAGQSRTVNNITWEFNLPGGDYIINVLIDSDNNVIESNGANNTKNTHIIG